MEIQTFIVRVQREIVENHLPALYPSRKHIESIAEGLSPRNHSESMVIPAT
jgi:hypothetical protein